MKKTSHVKVRQQQRSIGNNAFALVEEHAVWVGPEALYMTNKSCREFEADCKLKLSEAKSQLQATADKAEKRAIEREIASQKQKLQNKEKTRNIKLVVCGGAVITGMRPSGKGLRTVRRGLRREGF